jgi:serine-type D-Ala-D-Ala carboxypeptidase/endopeptidase (penicillin-binding protein 4)
MGRLDYREARSSLHGPGGPSSRPVRPRNRIALLVALLGTGLVHAPAAEASLRSSLARALVTPGVSSNSTGAMAYDLSRSRVVYSQNRSLSLRPASNEKLTVAVTALDRLGPGARIPTEVRGEGTYTPDGVWHGRLVLKGHGDPALYKSDLRRLARRVRGEGIVRVTGAIVADETYFDKARVGPGWKPSYYKDESPPLSALIVNRARVDRHVSSDPARAAGVFFKRALKAAGVGVAGRVKKAAADPGSAILARVRSRQLGGLVQRMNRVSDNFFAEMLLKLIGAKVRGNGTTAAGAAVVRSTLRNHGVPLRGVRIADGSGLSAYDRLTAKAVTYLLIWGVSDAEFSRSFVRSLPVAGVNGTLEDRLRSGPAYRHVLAKTGTTNRASALSGYVTSASAGPRYVFAILQNGNPIPYWNARAAQDRFAQVLARAAQ